MSESAASRWERLAGRLQELHVLIGSVADRLGKHEAATRPDVLRELAVAEK